MSKSSKKNKKPASRGKPTLRSSQLKKRPTTAEAPTALTESWVSKMTREKFNQYRMSGGGLIFDAEPNGEMLDYGTRVRYVPDIEPGTKWKAGTLTDGVPGYNTDSKWNLSAIVQGSSEKAHAVELDSPETPKSPAETPSGVAKPVWAGGNSYHLNSFSSWSFCHEAYSTEYRGRFLAHLAGVASRALIDMDRRYDQFTSIIGVGVSGALLVPSLADMLGRPFAMMRQHGSVGSTGRDHATHSGRIIGFCSPYVLFVDDLVDTGSTLMELRDVFATKQMRGGAGNVDLKVGGVLSARGFPGLSTFSTAPSHDGFPSSLGSYMGLPAWVSGYEPRDNKERFT